MKIILTGATSLTGFWFAETLKAQGHEVLCLLTKDSAESYASLKSAQRFNILENQFALRYSAPFGSDQFLKAIDSSNADLLCLHGAHIPGYKSQGFNIAESLAYNLRNVSQVFDAVKQKRMRLVLTGTLFEPNEGNDGKACDAASPYGLAKGLITETFRYFSSRSGVPLRHFVIPNPFGELEDEKFNSYAMDCWWRNEAAKVKTPDYIRDNIPVTLLALAYAQACADTMQQKDLFAHTRPSGYVGSQGEFANLMATRIREILGLACAVELLPQADFSEPMDRHNSENAFQRFSEFSEEKFWKDYAHYYAQKLNTHQA